VRREFQLNEEDVAGLDGAGYAWDAIVEQRVNWVVVRGFSIPAGYNVPAADAALRIGPSYPDDQIDMVYFHPALALQNGRQIKALTPFALEQKQYQQWSRHRTAANPWRPGLDNVCTHLIQVRNWLDRELPGAS